MEIKEKYKELSKKHKLPSFEEIDKDFEISTIEDEEFLLREVRRKIADKMDLYAKFLEEVLQPEPTTSNMYESKEFNEKEREDIFRIYKKLMFLNRFSIEASINESDEKTSEFIEKSVEEWVDIKEKILPIIKKVKESWLEDTDIKEQLGYMG